MMLPVSDLIKELQSDFDRYIEKDMERHELDRRSGNNGDRRSHIRRSSDRLTVEYEAVLSDPRRI